MEGEERKKMKGGYHQDWKGVRVDKFDNLVLNEC